MPPEACQPQRLQVGAWDAWQSRLLSHGKHKTMCMVLRKSKRGRQCTGSIAFEEDYHHVCNAPLHPG